ncbi:MAG: hypothetical protein ACLFVU_06495 [Phycisphaerae bacterium]
MVSYRTRPFRFCFAGLEELFRGIVVARMAYPTSKLKTIDYLYRYQGKTVSVQEVYRFLDRLNE